MQGNFTFYILIALVVGYLAYYFIWRQKEAKKLQEWLDQHPNAVKVYTKGKISLIGSGTLTIIDVDGEQPKQFTEGLKGGFYVLPGTHVVCSQYQKQRASLVYKSVTTTYDATKQEIEVEAGKTYLYSFDEKEAEYKFEEIDDHQA